MTDAKQQTVDMNENVEERGETLLEQEQRMTRKAWLGCLALGIVQNAALQPIVLASITKKVDDKLGPEPYYNWIMIGYNTTTALIFPITGGLSDIFGRRAFLVAGSVVMIIGYIVALCAKSMPMIITAMVIQGFGSGAQQLAAACIGEIVPKKDRGNAQAAMDLMILPWNVFGNLMGMSMVKRYELGYKINFIIGIVLNVFAMITLFLFYKPEPRPLPQGRTKLQELARIDWIGIFLYSAAIVLTLVALSLGGVDIPYAKPGFYLLFISGILSAFALAFWEWKGAREPFFARSLFVGQAKRIPFYFVLVFITGMTTYSSLALWPQQVQGMYYSDPDKIGYVSTTTGAASAVGGVLGGVLLGRAWFFETRFLLIAGFACKIGSDVMLSRATPDTLTLAILGAVLGPFGIGLAAVATITAVQLSCAEKDIGLASLLLQSLRAAGGSTALAVYANFIQNAFKTKIVTLVVPYIKDYMGSIKDIAIYFRLMTTGQFEAAKAQPGVDARAVSITHDRLGWVWASAFKNIYLTSLGFTAFALVLSVFAGNVRPLMTRKIMVHMQNDSQILQHHQKGEKDQASEDGNTHEMQPVVSRSPVMHGSPEVLAEGAPTDQENRVEKIPHTDANVK